MECESGRWTVRREWDGAGVRRGGGVQPGRHGLLPPAAAAASSRHTVAIRAVRLSLITYHHLL